MTKTTQKSNRHSIFQGSLLGALDDYESGYKPALNGGCNIMSSSGMSETRIADISSIEKKINKAIAGKITDVELHGKVDRYINQKMIYGLFGKRSSRLYLKTSSVLADFPVPSLKVIAALSDGAEISDEQDATLSGDALESDNKQRLQDALIREQKKNAKLRKSNVKLHRVNEGLAGNGTTFFAPKKTVAKVDIDWPERVKVRPNSSLNGNQQLKRTATLKV